MKDFLNLFEQNPWLQKLVISLFILAIIIICMKFVMNLVYNRLEDNGKYYKIRKRAYYITTIFYMIILVFIWLEMVNNFTTYMGLLSAGIAIALRELFANMAAWFFIMIRKPFFVGDRIFIHGQRGDVIDIRIFQFSLMELNSPEDGGQSTGRIIDIPNHFVFLYPIVNYVKGFGYVWEEIKVEITFESDWEKAKREFEKIVDAHVTHFSDYAKKEIQEAAKKYMIYYNKFTPIVYTDVRESGVLLTLRFLCAPKDKRRTTNDIWEDILRFVNSNEDVDLAYPTYRVVR